MAPLKRAPTDPPSSSLRPLPRASTLRYDPPSATSSDADSNADSSVTSMRRMRRRKTPWYKRMKRFGRSPKVEIIIEHRNGGRNGDSTEAPPGSLWNWKNWGSFLGLGRKITPRAASMASLSYSYTTSSIDSLSSDDEGLLPEMRVFNYDIREVGIRANPGDAVFDSSNFNYDPTPYTGMRMLRPGDERQRQLTTTFRNAYSLEDPSTVKLVVIHNNADAMCTVIRDAFSDSLWFSRYGEKLIERTTLFGSGGELGYSTNKSQVFRILPDAKRNMIQSAFCVNNWVLPLEDDRDNTDRLEQLVVYWQFRWPNHQEEVADGSSSTGMPGPAETPSKDSQEIVNATVGTASSSDKRVEKRTSKSDDIDEAKESLYTSNLIVVFERSKIPKRHRRSGRPIVLDDITNVTPTGNVFRASEAVCAGHPEERVTSLHIFEMLKYLIENVCDSLFENLDQNVSTYAFRRTRLAEKVYQKPEDDTIASKLWVYYRVFQSAGKIINSLILLVEDIRSAFDRHLDNTEPFLVDLQFPSLAEEVENELQKPTGDMIDLVYKSVSIKDARLSLELNSSLWRLSWVTFIFLPLTFLGTFFGMNVDTFTDDPSIKWYFIAAVPFLICVIVSWLLFKFLVNKQPSKTTSQSSSSIWAATAGLFTLMGLKRRARHRQPSSRARYV